MRNMAGSAARVNIPFSNYLTRGRSMADEKFTIANKEWARKRFPERFRNAAMRKHGYTPGASLRGLVRDVYLELEARVTKATISRWLDGSMFPGPDKLLLISEKYGVSPSELVGNNDAPESTDFSFEQLEQLLPRPLLIHVLTIMSELRASAKNLTDEWFAEATVRLLEKVSRNPEMSKQEIMGHAYELLRNGPHEANSASQPSPDR